MSYGMLLSTGEVAKMCGVSIAAVRKWHERKAKGRPHAVQSIGRNLAFDAEEVRAYAKKLNAERRKAERASA